MNWRERVGKKVKSKETGEVTTVETYADSPSVTLKNGIGFCIDSPVGSSWEIHEEEDNWKLSDKFWHAQKDDIDNAKFHPVASLQEIKTFIQKVKKEQELSFLFSDRKKLADEYENWREEHHAEECPLNVITWFYSKFSKKNEGIIDKRAGDL